MKSTFRYWILREKQDSVQQEETEDWELLKTAGSGRLDGSAVWCLPSAQGLILGSRDRVPHRAPCMRPASPSACVSASLSLSLMNK